MTPHKQMVGHRLRVAIEELGIKQAKVSRDFGVSPSKLGNWLRGEHYPDVAFLLAFCERYGITTDWFLRGLLPGMGAPLADALWAAERASEPASEGESHRVPKKPS